MKIRNLLAVAGASTVVASASAFDWNPAIIQPNPSMEVTQVYQLETLRFATNASGLATTDVVPVWIDEDENEISGVLSASSDPVWDDYVYNFNFSEFKSNGEYTLIFPEGLLVNADGEKSAPKEFYFTVELSELAKGMFDDFKILSISPDLSEPQSLWSDQKIIVNTNHNDAIGLTKLFVKDNTTGEIYINSSSFYTERKLGNSSPIEWTVANSYKFLDDRTYTAELVFYNGEDDHTTDGFETPIVAREYYTFTGKVEGFKYSDLTLESIDPAPLTLIISEPSQAVFTYTFSGPVTVYKALTPLGQNGNNVYPSSCLSSNDDKTVWTLDLSNDDFVKTIDSMLTINIFARDMDGYQLEGDFGLENESCFVAEWACELGAKKIVVSSPQNGETLDRVTEIVVKSESGEAMTWSWTGQAELQNLLGDVLGTLVYEEPENGAASATEFRFTKMMDNDWNVTPLNIVEEGAYVIYFGPGCFNFGEQFEGSASKSVYSGFNITGNADDTPDNPGIDPAEQETFNFIKSDPANGSDVESIQTIRLTFPSAVGLNGGEVTVYNSGNEVVTEGYCDLDWDDWDALNDIIVNLNTTITAAGSYEIVIPARSIISDGYEEGKTGTCNPEIRLSYTILGGSAVGIVESTSASNVFDMQGRVVLRNASAAETKALNKGIYIVNGKKLVVK
ncbi:MAG: hypothetical protein K2K32_08905 [Muribaculaceae bacterium]|nr:hypothetical protein [Muribaculaceae bacterium]